MNILDIFSKNTQISIFLKNRPVEAKLFPAERRTDRRTDRHDEAKGRFLEFCERE
jgi:hypothetical protein